MALDIGGFEQRPDWPKMGPSLLIGTCLILAIRTAKWPATFNERCDRGNASPEFLWRSRVFGPIILSAIAFLVLSARKIA
jgi:hypothetical protein